MKKVPNKGPQSSISEKLPALVPGMLALNSISSEDIQANDLGMDIEPIIKKSSVNIRTAPSQMVRIIGCEIYYTKNIF